jgi:uncharacterized membrane protein YdjX (TVP38/TMEM64 family)
MIGILAGSLLGFALAKILNEPKVVPTLTHKGTRRRKP